MGDRVVAHLLPPAGAIPNHPRWPLLIYPAAVVVRDTDPAGQFEALFNRNSWPAAWRNGIHPFHHFHEDGHEALGIFSGEVDVEFGGKGGVVVTAKPGDVIVLPAGTGHRRVAVRGLLGVVGAYPGGVHPGTSVPPSSRRQWYDVAAVPRPLMDPVYGAGGPLFEHWR